MPSVLVLTLDMELYKARLRKRIFDLGGSPTLQMTAKQLEDMYQRLEKKA